MRIGILEAGVPSSDLAERFGRYDAMTAAVIGGGFDFVGYCVRDGHWPSAPGACDGYVVTGSTAGIYDDLPWIAPLKSFLLAARGRAKLVGICFGHQIMAEAFGGRAEKSERGWGLGLHRYEIAEPAGWMDSAAPIAVPVSHQDQVTVVPPGARVLGGSGFTPFGVLEYGADAISMQCHPKFPVGYARALLSGRHADRLGLDETARLSATLDAPNDCARVGGWIRRFLRGGEIRTSIG